MTDDDLRTILASAPWPLLAQAYNQRVAQRRKADSPGRPKLLRQCDRCGQMMGARELRSHKPKCVLPS